MDKWGTKRQRAKPNTIGFYQKPQLIDFKNNRALIKKKKKVSFSNTIENTILKISNYQVTVSMRENLLSGNWLADEVLILLFCNLIKELSFFKIFLIKLLEAYLHCKIDSSTSCIIPSQLATEVISNGTIKTLGKSYLAKQIYIGFVFVNGNHWNCFFASSDNGLFYYFDPRGASSQITTKSLINWK